MKLWEGRFDAPTAGDADAFNESLSFDKKLWRADITASVAHVTMLGRCGIISEEEANVIAEGLQSIYADIERGALAVEGAENSYPASGRWAKNCTRRAPATIRWRRICACMCALPPIRRSPF